MSNFPELRKRALDNNGNVLPGATLTFYAAGTATLQSVYTTKALTTPLANPLVADGDGYFARFFGDPTKTYKVILATAAGVTIYTEDTIDCLGLAAAATTSSAVSPLDYGAIGDGAADESTAVQSAITAATGTLELRGKTYRCDHALTLKSNLEINGPGTLDFSNCADDEYIKAVGTLGDAVALTAPASKGGTSLSVTTTGLQIGDLLLLTSSSVWRGGTHTTGELVVVSDVEVGSLDVSTALRDDYAASVSTIRKITPVSNGTLEDVVINGSTAASGIGTLFRADKCTNLALARCQLTGIKAIGTSITTCRGVRVEDCIMEDGAGGGAVGVQVGECSEHVVVDGGTIQRVGTGIDIGTPDTIDGVCRDIVVKNVCIAGNIGNGIAAGVLAEHIDISHNDIESTSSVGINIGEDISRLRVIGNKVRTVGSVALAVTGSVDTVTVAGNLFVRADTAGPCTQFVGTAADDITNVSVVGNHFEGGTYGIYGSNVKSGEFARDANTFNGQATGTVTGVGDNVSVDHIAAATATIEDLTVSDDLGVGDDATVGGDLGVTGAISGGSISSSGVISGGSLSTTGALTLSGQTASRLAGLNASKQVVSLASPATTKLTENVTMTNAQEWYDGPSVTLGTGTWLISGALMFALTGGSSWIQSRVLYSLSGTVVDLDSSGQAGDYMTISFPPAVLTLVTSTVVKLQAYCVNQGGNVLGGNSFITVAQVG